MTTKNKVLLLVAAVGVLGLAGCAGSPLALPEAAPVDGLDLAGDKQIKKFAPFLLAGALILDLIAIIFECVGQEPFYCTRAVADYLEKN